MACHISDTLSFESFLDLMCQIVVHISKLCVLGGQLLKFHQGSIKNHRRSDLRKTHVHGRRILLLGRRAFPQRLGFRRKGLSKTRGQAQIIDQDSSDYEYDQTGSNLNPLIDTETNISSYSRRLQAGVATF